MGIFGERNPAFLDLDRGVVGTFRGTVAQGTEPDHVFIEFSPCNSFKKIRYANSVPKIAIHTIFPSSNADTEHIEKEMVILWEGRANNILHFIDTKNQKMIVELQNKIKDLEVEKAAAMQRAEEAYSGPERIVQRAKNLTKDNKPSLDPFARRPMFEDI